VRRRKEGRGSEEEDGIPLHPLPHYLSPSSSLLLSLLILLTTSHPLFLSIHFITTSLPPSSPSSSSLPLSFFSILPLSHPHYRSPPFLSILRRRKRRRERGSEEVDGEE
jgi:hypothetical protein